jgi:hypothetical protein
MTKEENRAAQPGLRESRELPTGTRECRMGATKTVRRLHRELVVLHRPTAEDGYRARRGDG